MKYKKTEFGYLLKLVQGEEIITELNELCEKEGIYSGWIHGIGAVESVVLGFFDVELKSYIREEIDDYFEIVNLMGNIAVLDGKPVLHMHITIGDHEFGAYGGHLFSALVSVTAEIFVIPFGNRIERKLDASTGLNLLDIE
ncbi:MAG: hypothetical protein A2161_00315 [Candidatus Schekmanbacteria bacterium RBG_13_48_7]|uniref:PPC domain-containing protein n=1 Tax=Candidatus Schekmanbacteria bacterium RBG_13_48_7 TaxID=1817878 RepID=A0A1F7S535_9BACT|nr:MAG: hypothetical protein A2161_00315 [Candidatus Schekmanbacteria bacterium RBG_13_48_7]